MRAARSLIEFRPMLAALVLWSMNPLVGVVAWSR